jgi:hypothetical protein
MTSGDLLLYVITAKREMSWAVFKRVFDTLAARETAKYENAAVARSVVMKSLDSLGYCEVQSDGDGLRVVATPSGLVRLPTGKSMAVLSGARSPESLDTLTLAAREFGITVESADQFGELSDLIPHKITISGSTDALLADYAKAVGLAFSQIPPAWSLAQLSVSLEEVIQALKWDNTPELNWPRADFDPEYNCFRGVADSRPAFRLTRYLDPIRNTFRHYVWDGDLCSRIDADWGRYFALQRADFSVIYFDRRLNLFAAPRTVPLPRLLARSVALCSGSVAHPLCSRLGKRNLDYVVYELVPETVAELVASKTGQDIIECRLEIAGGGAA